jgi:hypothetical protein
MIMCLSIVFPPQNLNIKLLHQTKTSHNVLYTQYHTKSMGGTALAPTTCDKQHNNSNLYQKNFKRNKMRKNYTCFLRLWHVDTVQPLQQKRTVLVSLLYVSPLPPTAKKFLWKWFVQSKLLHPPRALLIPWNDSTPCVRTESSVMRMINLWDFMQQVGTWEEIKVRNKEKSNQSPAEAPVPWVKPVLGY